MKKIILAIALTSSLPAQADDVECTAIALSMFTAKYIETRSDCSISGNASAMGLDLFGNCRLHPEVVQKVMSTAKSKASGSCASNKETYTNLTNAFITIKKQGLR
jgi:hypothetical protein